MNTENTLEQIIRETTDDLLHFTAGDMGIQHSIEASPHSIRIRLKAGFPPGSLEAHYLPKLKKALKTALPAINIELQLESFIKAHQTQLLGKALRGVKNTIAVASGKGGVGKSTVAVNLAVALAKQGARVGLLDADIYGPSVPLMLGEASPVQVQGEHYKPVTAHGIDAMSIGYLTDNEQALIWRGPMLAKSLLQMLSITLWDELDYLFIDLPPGTGDIQLSLVQKIPLSAAIIVTTPQNIATLDAQKAIAMFNKTGIHVLGLVENMSLHVCSQCGHQEAIFGEGGAEKLAQSKKALVIGALPLDARIRQNSDAGEPIAGKENDPLAEAFDKIALRSAVELAKRPVNHAGKFPDIVVE